MIDAFQGPAVVPGARVLQRIAELEAIRTNLLRYQDDRVRERDHHGSWDVAISLAETDAEIAGLRFALETFKQDGVAP